MFDPVNQWLDLFTGKEEWTVENNLLTPTLKIKRSDIEAKFKHFLEMDISTPIYWDE